MTSGAQDWARRAQGRTGGGPTGLWDWHRLPLPSPPPHSFKKPLQTPPAPPPSPIPASRPHQLTFPQTNPWPNPCCEHRPEAPGKGQVWRPENWV